ncbi:S41 family peptidase [bacterium]
MSLLIFQCIPGSKQNPPDNPYVSKRDPGLIPDYSVNKADLLSDIDMYIDKIDNVHPDPYRLISKVNFIAEAEKVKAQIKASDKENIHIFDGYYYLQKLAALIQDGHTKIYNPANWEKTVSSFFPINIKIVEGRVFVNQNFGDNEIPLKAEILSINNKNVKEIISEMLNYCEGTFREFKLIRIEEEFRYFIHTLYKSGPPWKIEYGFTDKKLTISIEGISYKILTEKNKKKIWFSESSVKINNQEIPILNLPHLGFRKQVFKPFIDKFCDNHIDTRNLIINLRGCPGGNGLRTLEVVDHLIDTPYSASKKMTFRISQVLKDYVQYYIQDYLYKKNKPIDEWEKILYSSGIWQDEYDDMYKIILGSDLNTYSDVGNHFHSPDKKISKYKGNVLLLVDHRSFSAAVVFASIFKHYNLATIVGRETGGRIDFFSDAVNIELPKTKLISKIPTATLTLHGEIPNRGIIPDITVDLSVDDFLSGNDPDIKAIKSVLKGGQ